MNPCAPRHHAARHIWRRVRHPLPHHAVARSIDCNPHVAGGIARALRYGLLGAGVAGGTVAGGYGVARAVPMAWDVWGATEMPVQPYVGPQPWDGGSNWRNGGGWQRGGDGSRGTPVPEPAGVWVLAVGLLGLLVVRRAGKY